MYLSFIGSPLINVFLDIESLTEDQKRKLGDSYLMGCVVETSDLYEAMDEYLKKKKSGLHYLDLTLSNFRMSTI